ncbi:hypothetical protein GY45DRAFT_743108 [Cubamyces sp. BRFM 1775]|nr:hypothetical protein GY45DRAFT_743108 [Cubamyces sp. BRFM 1775]
MLRLNKLNDFETAPGRPIRARQGSIINGLAAHLLLVMITGLHADAPLGLRRCSFAQHDRRFRPSYSGYFRIGWPGWNPIGLP